MAKKSIEETYGLDVANYVKSMEDKQFQEQQEINKRKEPQKDFGLPIADQQYKEKQKQQESFPTQDEIAKTHKYIGEIELEGGNGNYWTVLQGPKGYIAGSPTNNGIMFNSDYFESIEELYEFLQQNPKFKDK